ncbi:MAG: hypothetical protein WCM76_15620 [Bacteroidota bacterium]
MRVFTVILLFFNVISAFYGGILLVLDPSGQLMQIPTTLLDSSPFDSFLIPGLILLIVIGAGSLMTAILTIRKSKQFYKWVVTMGSGLIIWILTELIMIREFSMLQVIYGGLGIILLFLGISLWNQNLKTS